MANWKEYGMIDHGLLRCTASTFFSGCNEIKVLVGIVGLRVLIRTWDLRNTKQAC
jgi:hypothetical protein